MTHLDITALLAEGAELWRVGALPNSWAVQDYLVRVNDALLQTNQRHIKRGHTKCYENEIAALHTELDKAKRITKIASDKSA